MAAAAQLRELMEGPLVTWLCSCLGESEKALDFDDLMDGIFIHEVFIQIEPDPPFHGIMNPEGNPQLRIRNLDIIVRNMKAFYEEELGQTIVCRLPDPVAVVRGASRGVPAPANNEGSDGGVDGISDMKLILQLLLGCAVQSNSKQTFVEGIKLLNLNTQHAIVECIKQVTDGPEMVLSPEWCEGVERPEGAFRLLVGHLKRLAKERDKYAEQRIALMLQDRGVADGEERVSGDGSSRSGSEGGTVFGESHHLAVELADSKGKLRRLRQELEEKSESLAECKEELEHFRSVVNKLRQENLDLLQDARSAKAYRDELDAVKEQAERASKLEQEVQRYRDKLTDIEYYKTRVEELREDNRVLMETNEMLEEQLQKSRKRAEQVLELEGENLKLKQQVNDLSLEHESDQDRIRNLIEETTQLQMKHRSSSGDTSRNSDFDLDNSHSSEVGDTSLSEQLSSSAMARTFRLELENQRLQSALENLRETSLKESNNRILELDKENKRLSLKVSQLQESLQRNTQRTLELEETLRMVRLESKRLEETLEIVQVSSDRQQEELQMEKQQLADQVETLRERQHMSVTAQQEEVETENRRMIELTHNLKNQINRMEFDKEQLTKQLERAKKHQVALEEMENQNAGLERENQELKMLVAALKESCESRDHLEEEHAMLELENRRLNKTLENLRETNNKLEEERKEHARAAAETQRLSRAVERLKADNLRLVELEERKEELNRANQDLKSQLETAKVDRSRLEELETSLQTTLSERQRVQRLLENSEKRIAEVERQLQQAESLRAAARRLPQVEAQLSDAEAESGRLERELTRLKIANEAKETMLDETMAKATKFEAEARKLQKELDNASAQISRLESSEQLRRTVAAQAAVDRETVAALQQDLISEKLASQQRGEELDSLRTCIRSAGIDPDHLLSSEGSCGFVRREEAESGKRTAVATLEARVAELVSELETLKRCKDVRGSECQEKEKANTLEKENASLQQIIQDLNNQAGSLQSQVTSLQNEASARVAHGAGLQSENARLQVELTTLQSQAASLASQNTALQLANTQLVAEKDKAIREEIALQSAHSQLSVDQTALQSLHEQLTSDYENLVKEREELKNRLRDQRAELRQRQEELARLSSSADETMRLQASLQAERDSLKAESKSLGNLRAEHSRLKDDFRSLFAASEKVKNEYRNLQLEYRTNKTENNTLRLRLTELQGEFANCQDRTLSHDVEVSRLQNKCEVLAQVNLTLEEDRRSLMDHVSLLLSQYHDLLAHTLEDKEHHHEEEKQFSDRLNDLKRQKEKLEEKIMEQYRRMENSSPKKRSFGANIVRKMRKAGSELINKVPRGSRSRLGQDHTDACGDDGTGDCCQDNLSLESDPASGGSNDSECDLASPEGVRRSALSLGSARTRCAVYYTDEDDSIPTRDAGPESTATASAGSSFTPINQEELLSSPLGFHPLNNSGGSENSSTHNVSSYLLQNSSPRPPSTTASESAVTVIAVEGTPGRGDVVQDVPATSESRPQGQQRSKNGTKPRGPENSIWYEYGCV